MDLPTVNPGDIIKAADINKISSGLEDLEALISNHTSHHDTTTVTVTDNGTYLTITVGV